MLAVKVENLTKYFGDKKVLDNLSFEVYRGEIFALIGHNGAGKTTTLRILSGIIKDFEGRVIKNGTSGYLPEERGLYKNETVYSLLKFFGELAEVSNLDKKIDYWLNRFNISKYKNYKIKELSKGNQQKVQLIISLIHNPDILILDEPFSGLDVVNVKLFIDVLTELKKDNKAIIISSHRLEYLDKICDRALILKNGKAIYYGALKFRDKVYIEILENNKIVKKEMPIEEAINILKNYPEKVIKYEIKKSLEDIFLETY
ncbi:ABC transporter ATP-binding protein [Methanocaldococcus indicus]|uniref:ABC transporter ATP-binding protein n=1 Tax=Methanocaldococcus indicus TaxID=213231 RepID=UPI003C6D7FC9